MISPSLGKERGGRKKKETERRWGRNEDGKTSSRKERKKERRMRKVRGREEGKRGVSEREEEEQMKSRWVTKKRYKEEK